MQDVVVSGWSVLQWWLPGLAAIAGALGGGLVLLLLLFPRQPAGIHGLVPLQGALGAGSSQLAAFSTHHLLHDLPTPRRFFEKIGPDRFRRELERVLRESIDGHVDDVMTRRTGIAWDALSSYARARIYNHVQQRLPFVIDDFIDQLQRELDSVVHPQRLVDRWFAGNSGHLVEIFLRVHGADLRASLLLAALLPALLTLPLQWLLPTVVAWWLTGALSAVLGVQLVYATITRRRAGFWSLGRQGIMQRHRERFLQALQSMIVHEALGWQVVTAEFMEGNQAGKMRHMMRREVAGILDVPMFRISMQLLLGPGGFAEVKTAAAEKAAEMLSSAAPSGRLREHYHRELERTLAPAFSRISSDAWADLWQSMLAPMHRRALVLAGLVGLALGATGAWLYALPTP